MNGPENLRGQGPEETQTLTTAEARQGETSGHVRAILAVSLSCAFIALIAVYLVFFG